MDETSTTNTGAAHPEFDGWWQKHRQEFVGGATAASCAYVAFQAGQQAKENKLSASEAVFGFVSWITTRAREVVAGASRDAAPWADIVQQFIDENDLEEPRRNWTDYLVHPSCGEWTDEC